MLRNIALPALAAVMALVSPVLPAQDASKAMIVLAHPDDEFMVGGTLCLLAEQGCDVQVVYATSGEAGLDVSGQGLSGEALAKTREKEVKESLEMLGVKAPPVFLRFKDGGLENSREELEKSVAAIFEKAKPDMVITFGPDGATGHPDHTAVWEAATEAFDDQKSCKTLLNIAISEKRKAALQECSNVDYIDNFFEGIDDASINIAVDTSKYRQRRVNSFFAHDTQFNQNYRNAWLKFTEAYPYEEYVVARVKGHIRNVSSIKDLLQQRL